MIRWIQICTIMLAVVAMADGRLAGQVAAQEEIGITRPSEESKRSFIVMGMVADIPVVEGQQIKKGDTLIQLDDSVEQKTLDILEIEAKSELLIEAAEKQREQAIIELQKQEELFAKRAGSEMEILRRKVEAEIADVKVRQAQEELQKKIVERDKQARQVELMRVEAPFDCVVAKIDAHIGEIVDPRTPAVVVVKNDPLWVEVSLPSAQAAKMEQTKTLKVRYHDEKPEQARQAKVIFLSPVVDAASDKRMVRLELPNPEGKPSGLQMIVELP